MIENKRVVVAMPAYNAAETLERTYAEIPHKYVDEILLVDDGSDDKTAECARALGITTIAHTRNIGYGGNQKTCYREACRLGADVVIMLHPDYQYSPRLVVPLATMIASGHYDVVLGSRILGGGARQGGMPGYKYVGNRFLTLVQNAALGAKLSEYHTGYRAFSREVLEALPLEENSDDFVFDNEMLCQALHFGFRIGEISCPARYFKEASSISFGRSVSYGLGVLATTVKLLLHRHGIRSHPLFSPGGRRLQKGVGGT